MAMRRRFRRTFRRRQRVAWDSVVFNESNITRAGLINEYVLVSSGDWDGDIQGVNKKGRIKRIHLNGGMGFVPNSTTFAQDNVALFGALYITDNEETDATILVTTAGSLIQAHRVLHTDVWAWSSAEVPTAQVGTAFGFHIKLSVDVKVNLTLEPDELLIWGMQFGSDVQETLSDARFSAYGRCLIEEP